MNRLPLIDRPADAPIAHAGGQTITVGQFLAQASALAAQLPPRRYALNLCSDRYTFSLSFAAVLIAGQTNLLPANRLHATVSELHAAYGDCLVLSDEATDYGCPDQIDPRARPSAVAVDEPPRIAGDHVAAIAFTSGSTGGSKPIAKPWATLFEGARINAREMGVDAGGPRSLVATVPPQHMYGLETSVLVPLVAPVAASGARPFTPLDIADTLAALPAPRLLVSTPVHLRAVVESGAETPAVERVFSATAPLDPELAQRIEARYVARLTEIYGCSEVGSLARREPARDADWTLFERFALTLDGELGHVSAPHLPDDAQLQDRIERRGARGLRLLGRVEDLVNIAGKRASLAELTQHLLRVPGVEDGVIFQPGSGGDSERLVALVVAPQMDAETVRRALRQVVDAAFLPRPIRMVTALPRSETGKLTRAALQQAFLDAGNTTASADPPAAGDSSA